MDKMQYEESQVVFLKTKPNCEIEKVILKKPKFRLNRKTSLQFKIQNKTKIFKLLHHKIKFLAVRESYRKMEFSNTKIENKFKI